MTKSSKICWPVMPTSMPWWMRASTFFVMGQHKHLLELNTLVLCGRNLERRAEFAAHIRGHRTSFLRRTARRDPGYRRVVLPPSARAGLETWPRASTCASSANHQLFIEGNHRTGVLVASYVLLRNGLPPFVLTVENARTYFDPSTVIRETNKLGLLALFRLPGIKAVCPISAARIPVLDYLLTTPAPNRDHH